MSAPLIWISAGELSGDMHAAALARALRDARPDARIRGIAGPYLREFGAEAVYPMENLAVMGFTEVFRYLPTVFSMLDGIRKDLRQNRPDAVVLVDAPSFNFRVAKIASEAGIPVYYYISPKVWASRPGRVRFMKRHIKRIISIFPFEEEFFKKYGMRADYVGNPTVDMLNPPALERVRTEPGRIGLMPGSRNKEISALLPIFADAARRILERVPDASFHCVKAPNIPESAITERWPEDIPLNIVDSGNRYEFMKSCETLLAASGTATLESALIGTPTVVAYKLSPFTGFIAKRFITVRYVSLPNLIMDRPVFPELLQENATGEKIADAALNWLRNPEAAARVRSDLAELRRILGEPGAAGRAARLILADAGLLA